MKKILSVLLAVCMLFAVATTTGCEASTAKAIDEAIKKTEALDEFEATFFIEMTVDMGFSVTIPTTVEVKAKNAKTSNPIVLASSSVSMLGMTVTADAYREDNMLYVSTNGISYKLKAEDSDGEYDYVDNINNVIKDIPEDLLENIELVKNDDGSKTAAISIDDVQFKEIFMDLIRGSAEDIEGEDEDSIVAEIMDKVTVNDASVKVTVKNGYVLSYEIAYAMNISTALGETSSSVRTSVTYNNPGKTVEITPPEGYKDFKDYSENIFDNLFG